MANLPNHLYGEQRYTNKRRGWDTRRGKKRVHLVAACPRCKAERERSEEHRASVENC